MTKVTHQLLLSIGSNSSPEENIVRAEVLLHDSFPDIAFTQRIRTEAIGKRGPMYLNELARASTFLSYEKVNDILKNIEQQLGRVHHHPKGLVTIDIDILRLDEQIYHEADWGRPYVQRLLQQPFHLSSYQY
ncbi:MAG: 2-amino-4-hydroxy-6-hydroxymethyldihydropteridine diphosphokinase [Prevotella sp.]|jgi:2-amino-4-hydroxy-6-hydroxymethyldihydropteridine diphosphokinase